MERFTVFIIRPEDSASKRAENIKSNLQNIIERGCGNISLKITDWKTLPPQKGDVQEKIINNEIPNADLVVAIVDSGIGTEKGFQEELKLAYSKAKQLCIFCNETSSLEAQSFLLKFREGALQRTYKSGEFDRVIIGDLIAIIQKEITKEELPIVTVGNPQIVVEEGPPTVPQWLSRLKEINDVIGNYYEGASEVLKNEKNPDRLAQASTSMRSMVEALCLDVSLTKLEKAESSGKDNDGSYANRLKLFKLKIVSNQTGVDDEKLCKWMDFHQFFVKFCHHNYEEARKIAKKILNRIDLEDDSIQKWSPYFEDIKGKYTLFLTNSIQ